MKDTFKVFIAGLFLLLLSGLTPACGQGTGSIRGTVKDAKTGEVVIGGTVRLDGTTLGDQTDANGKFTLAKVPAG